MAPARTALATKTSFISPQQLDPAQTLRASSALLRKIQADEAVQKDTSKANLLDDADDGDEPEGETPIWLVLTTKKHIADKKRLKPGKISLPHPYTTAEKEGLRICLVTADPQRKYKDLVAEPGFPLALAGKIKRVIGMEKLKSKCKSYESKRQLLGEYDVFLADDRIITYLPQVLGKVFYKGGSKRPIPVNLQGKRQNVDEQGHKRRKLAEGGSKVVKTEARAEDVAHEVGKALNNALVHLAPSTTTAIKVGTAKQTPEQLQANIEAVVEVMVERYVPQQWNNMRSAHIKGPNTAALPIWLTQELWTDEHDVLDEAPKANEGKKRKRGALTGAAPEVIEVPGPDGKMRRLEKPTVQRRSTEAQTNAVSAPAKGRKNDAASEDISAESKAADKAEKAARKKALAEQKETARADKAAILDSGDSAPKKMKTGKKAKTQS